MNVIFTSVWMMLLIGVIVLLVVDCIKVVPQEYTYVIEFLGKYKKTWEAGLHFKIPVLERVAAKVSLKEQTFDFPPQNIITRDNVTITVDSVVFSKVFDPRLYTYGIENAMYGLENLSATTLRNILGEMDLDQTLSSRQEINAKMESILDEATDKWGIKVTRVEIKNIEPPVDIEEAMTKQMKAEREKRQVVLEAQAHQESVETRAKGDKAAKIMAAEAEKEAKIAIAEGEARRIQLTYEAQAKGLEALKNADIDNSVLRLRGIDALKDIADGRATKIFMPTDLQDVVSLVGSVGETLGIGEHEAINKAPKEKPAPEISPDIKDSSSSISVEADSSNRKIFDEDTESES